MINEVPISLIHYLGDKNNFDDLYINFSKNKGGNISEGDGQTLSEALALINNLTQKAIENVKAKIRADTDGSLRLPKLKFYVSETIHKTLMGDEFNVEQHSYYSFAAKQNDVTLSTNTTSKVSFKDIFNRVRIRYYKEGNFNENSFDLRKWLILMPTILKETYKQYDLLVNAATIFENWQPYEDLYNYISTNTTLIVNTGDIQGPLYGSQNNSQETEWFGQPINSANTKYNSWQNLKNLPEETFLLLDQEKALKILYILSAHISSAAIRNSSQQTTVNSYELDDEFQETVINLFKYFNGLLSNNLL